jgi:hypothetical protein
MSKPPPSPCVDRKVNIIARVKVSKRVATPPEIHTGNVAISLIITLSSAWSKQHHLFVCVRVLCSSDPATYAYLLLVYREKRGYKVDQLMV